MQEGKAYQEDCQKGKGFRRGKEPGTTLGRQRYQEECGKERGLDRERDREECRKGKDTTKSAGMGRV